MVDPQAGVPRPAVPLVVPEGPGRRVARMQRPQPVGPALVQQPAEGGAGLRLQQGVGCPGARRIDVRVGGDDVVVPRQHHRRPGGVQRGRMRLQPAQPPQLVVELGARPRIAVGGVEAADQHPVHGRLDVAGLGVGGIARQAAAGEHRLGAPRQDRHPVPGPLAAPDRPVAGLPDCGDGEGGVLGLELLQADGVRPRLLQPRQQVGQALDDVVDVEGGDLHRRRGHKRRR